MAAVKLVGSRRAELNFQAILVHPRGTEKTGNGQRLLRASRAKLEVIWVRTARGVQITESGPEAEVPCTTRPKWHTHGQAFKHGKLGWLT
jgi:hypothetical protein